MEFAAWLKLSIALGSISLTLGDALGFATGLLCVWLTAKASIRNFPWGIVNSLILGVVFLDQRLFADAGLQVVFVVLSAQGWVQWHRRFGPASSAFHGTTARDQLVLLAAGLGMAVLLWAVLEQLRGSAPPRYALITAFSLCAQWQLNRRQVSSWYWWIAVDLVSIPLYWSRGWYLIAVLYVVILAICFHGLRNWQRAQRSIAPANNLSAA
ncbi:nicotinamide riboside transporter PnuC [Rhodoferax aquaticus]|uniref:Nicotinamide riboside transporter PnuC n=1 Tax=Rhodoferax aquaticus TaxID=2527691 RepID=A0A515ESY1_9BURK|nr:nicotinamide riboside transporter PnuC [Rhodoferax aquaticus]QDL55787.1 nicotinamide riboside transporter PnuC [Rhodoferax aquaticus]